MSSASRPPDGAMDFRSYSTAQLLDLQYSLDRETYPLNFAHLLQELARRGEATTGADAGAPGLTAVTVSPPPSARESVDRAAANRWSVAYTAREGLRGWFEAKGRHSRLYGSGAIAIDAEEVRLSGWRRTWLGIGEQVELVAPVQSIRNAVREDRRVWFAVGRGPARGRFEVTLATDSEAQALLARLPATRSAGFGERWEALRQFQREVRGRTPHLWVTPAIVAVDIAVYVAMAIENRRFWALEWQQLDAWGANAGALTLSGQWWRLLTAAFLHLTPLHIAVNLWVLWWIGRLTERLFGNWRFLGLYLLTAVLASLSSIAWDPNQLSVGASGAIFAVFGAFLAYLMHPQTRVPRSVLRAHWLSTTIFVLFNLVSGFLQTGVDNGAHVGGLMSGFVLGWIIAAPLGSAGRDEHLRGIWLRQMAATAAVIATWVVASLWAAGGVGANLAPSQRYMQSHLWFVQGEARDLAEWQQAAMQGQAGTISSAQIAQRFRQDIVPFWRTTAMRLKNESTAPPMRPIATAMLDYAQARLAWANAVVAAAANPQAARMDDMQRLSKESNLAVARLQRISLLDVASHHLRGLTRSPLVVRLRWLIQRAPACVHEPAAFESPVAPGDNRRDGPALGDAIGCEAQAAFVSGDYSKLQSLLDLKTHPLGDLPYGGSSYAAAWAGLHDLLEFGRLSVDDELAHVADWRRVEPHSPLPDLVEVDVFEDWAWGARGFGTADTISAQQQLLENMRIEMANVSLAEAPRTARDEPVWYTLSMDLAVDQSLPLAEMRNLYDQGHSRFPDYHPLDRDMLRVLMPRWFGTYELVDQFITERYTQAAAGRHFETYAQLYWTYALLEGDDVDVYKESRIEWPVIQDGFEQMTMQYPGSDYLLNGFAYMACRAGDKAQYRNLRTEVGRRFSASAWTKKYSLANCDQRLGATPVKNGTL